MALEPLESLSTGSLPAMASSGPTTRLCHRRSRSSSDILEGVGEDEEEFTRSKSDEIQYVIY